MLELGARSFVSGIKATWIALRSGARNHHLIKQAANIIAFVMSIRTHSFTSDAFLSWTHLRPYISFLTVATMTAVEE